MLDIKVLRVRNIAAIKNYDFVTTILVNNVDGILSIRGVQVNNEPVGYVVASADELIVMLPTGISKLDDVYSVVLEREATDGNIREVLLVNTSQLDKTGGSRVSPLYAISVWREFQWGRRGLGKWEAATVLTTVRQPHHLRLS